MAELKELYEEFSFPSKTKLRQAAKKMQEEGKDYKPIYGGEAYFIPSIDEWREEYETAMEDKKREGYF